MGQITLAPDNRPLKPAAGSHPRAALDGVRPRPTTTPARPQRRPLHQYIVLLLACLMWLLPTRQLLAAETYVVGVVPQFDARQIHRIWRPILDAIEQETGLQLVLAGSPSIPAFEKQFAYGEFDFAYMNPYHAVGILNRQGYQPLVRDAGRSLHGIVVVRKDSAFQDVHDLDNKTIAFPAPNSLAASLLVRAAFLNELNIQVAGRYVQTHSSVYLNVALGQTDAGGGVQKTLDQQPAAVRDALRVIYRTPDVAPHPLTVHPRVPVAVHDKVRSALLKLGETASGRKLLAGIPIRQIGPASRDDYLSLTKMGLDNLIVEQ